jgi:predicted NAD/FAD-binding protein
MGYGFHEDGLGAAVEAVSSLGVELPDAIDQARAYPAPYTKNFEPWSGPGSHLIHG